MEKIGIIGVGLIGSSWAALFSSKGLNVNVYDQNLKVENEFRKKVKRFLSELKFF